jgi:hypothetical protein
MSGQPSPNRLSKSATRAATAAFASTPSALMVRRSPKAAPSVVNATALRASTTSFPRVMVILDRNLNEVFAINSAGRMCNPSGLTIAMVASAAN